MKIFECGLMIFGACLVLFHRQFAKWSDRIYALEHIPHADEATLRIFYIFGGIFVAMIGLVNLFRITRKANYMCWAAPTPKVTT
jgi:hypothetical protein